MSRVIPPPTLYGAERKWQTGKWTYLFKEHTVLSVIPETLEAGDRRIRLHLDMVNPSVEEMKGQTNWYCDSSVKALEALLEEVVEVVRQRLLVRIQRSEDMAERCLIHARRHRQHLEQLGGVIDPPTLWDRLHAP